MNPVIEQSLAKSISYKDYKTIVEDLVAKSSTSGNEKTEELAYFTKLNDRRMKRWDKTIKLSEEDKNTIAQFENKMTWLVITESWCGDAAHVIPAINKVAEQNENIELRLVFRDENDLLMEQYLTNGSRSIPKLIMIDEATEEVVKTYGPRPSKATKMVLDFKNEFGKLTPEFKEELQYWYNKDKGQTIVKDLMQLMLIEA